MSDEFVKNSIYMEYICLVLDIIHEGYHAKGRKDIGICRLDISWL
jgi:hypothetical protein